MTHSFPTRRSSDLRAAYDNLVLWWSENAFDKHLYIGLGAYRIREWGDRKQMPRQLNYARNYSEVSGFVFFSSNSLLTNPLGFTDSLRNHYLIGRAHVLTPVTNAHLVCRLMLEKKK